MRIVLTTIRRLLILLIVAAGLLGLAMKYLDLPGGPAQALRALPQRLASELEHSYAYAAYASVAMFDGSEPLNMKASGRRVFGCQRSGVLSHIDWL